LSKWKKWRNKRRNKPKDEQIKNNNYLIIKKIENNESETPIKEEDITI